MQQERASLSLSLSLSLCPCSLSRSALCVAAHREDSRQLATPPHTRQVAIVYYSMYGHIRTMALEVKKGLEAAGCKVTLLRVAETLPDEVLTKMGAPGVGKDDEVATAASLADYDGLMFGIPTRFGMAPAQVKALMDSTGGLWQKGAVRLRRPRTQSKQRGGSLLPGCLPPRTEARHMLRTCLAQRPPLCHTL